MSAIKKILIANRGEIAARVMRTARARGVRSIAVYSDADANAYHVREADEAVHIGGAAPAESYLNIDAVIEAAKKTGADAIHPGYGFLSERAEFADACEAANIVFLGPSSSAIAAMGDKAESKRRMIAVGVPTIPGYQGDDQADDVLVAEADKIGFPVMVKASAGGGGRGMRIVQSASELVGAIASARKEAESAFGDGRLLMERAVSGARHVEVQIIGDAHGHVIHLGERDCSLQRRNQKVIEEAPSPVISADMRSQMGEAAVKAAQAVNYQGVGTVEFLFDPARQEFYFLEMNTRLQVEHPVTELVSGLDLVALQFDVAEGKSLPFQQSEIVLDGWAMEARLYAEDPGRNFMPQTGVIAHLEFAEGEGVRIDAGIGEGDEISAFYDPMIAKIIAHGASRNEARGRLVAALRETTLFGLGTNAGFLINLLNDETFASGEADTQYIESNLKEICGASYELQAIDFALVAAVTIDRSLDNLLDGWNSRGAQFFPMKLKLVSDDETAMSTGAAKIDGSEITGRTGDEEATIKIIAAYDASLEFLINGVRQSVKIFRQDNLIHVKTEFAQYAVEDLTFKAAYSDAGAADAILAPMAGLVTGVATVSGAQVTKGQVVATIEAMKMEHHLKAPRDGVIAEVLAAEGDQVAIRTKLIMLKLSS